MNVRRCIYRFLPLAAVTMLMVPSEIVGRGLAAEPLWIGDTDWPGKHVEVADLNGDGTPDVILGEYSSDYYGSVHHVFALDGSNGDTLWIYQINDGARSMTIGDLNNDGVADVVVGAAYSSETPDGRVHAINGATGTALWTFPINATNEDVCIGDFNGDQYPDVAVASFDDYVYAINGANGAQLWRRLIGSLWVNAVATGDVNGDNIDDVAFAHEYLTNYNNYFGVINGATGNFIWDSTVTWVALDCMIADIDNDGSLEAIYSGVDGSNQGFMSVRNSLTGAVEWSYNFGTVDHVNGEIRLFAYDIDSDSDLDLVIGNFLGWRSIIAFDGEAPVVMYQSDSLASYPERLAFGDITGDGNLDIAAATWDRVSVVSAVNGSLEWYYAVAGRIYSVAVGDFDGDGVKDLAAAGTADAVGTPPNPGKTVWALRTVASPVWWEFAFGQYGNGMTLADITGDGALDAIAVASLDDWVWVVDGVTGEEVWHWTGTANLYAVTTGDFDDDGVTDVAVAGADAMVTALDGKDGSIFWQATQPNEQLYRKCLASADMNGDGHDDVIAGSDDGTIYVFDGNSGTKADIIWSVPFGGGDAEEVEVADMNFTGPLDVVAIVGGRMVVLDGSDGSELWTYDVGTANARGCEALDANDDGILDVAIAITGTSGSVVVVDGAPPHNVLWTKTPISPSYDYPLSHGRCNDDKAEDLLVATSGTVSRVYAFDGVTGAQLWSQPAGSDFNCVLGADVNGDGIDDAVAGADDHMVYAFDGATGDVIFNYACAGDVMHVGVGDVTGTGAVSIACVTFDADGVIYAFKPLYEGSCCVGITGNIDGDPSESIDIIDLIYLVDYMFSSGPPPPCLAETDVDGNATNADIADLVYLVTYMFNFGFPPVACH